MVLRNMSAPTTPPRPQSELQPLTRFTDRVEDYIRYRPNYPAALFGFLGSRAQLGPQAVVADVGSGTGIFSEQLLERGATVFAVEPNAAMRTAAESRLSGQPRFVSVEGTSTATGLVDGTVSLITCAQAFHWFEPAETRREFWRISRPAAQWALVWNSAPDQLDALNQEFERIKLAYGTDFVEIRHQGGRARQQIERFFGPGRFERFTFRHFQLLDREGLRGRMLSSSYAPKAGDPRHAPMVQDLDRAFDAHQQAGWARIDYDTELYLGRPLGPL